MDGEHAASAAIDKEVPRMGQVQACRRVARAVFLGSVPSKATRGMEDNRDQAGHGAAGRADRRLCGCARRACARH